MPNNLCQPNMQQQPQIQTKRKTTPQTKEWRPNVSAPAFKPGRSTPKAVQQQPPTQQQPQTPQMNPQSPPGKNNRKKQF